MARAIHRASRRRDQPYLSVNLGAVPVSLAASELFGAAKGAFTGAVRAQAGYFARATGARCSSTRWARRRARSR
jgi:two-component system, NtrC family, nitrogen regulation response regulator GlnG